MGNGNDLNRALPVVDYTSLDAASSIADMITYAQANFADRWTDFNEGQIARVNMELTAYEHDKLTFYMNALINECFSKTALRRQSLINKGAELDYVVPSAVAASVTVDITFDAGGVYPADILAASHSVTNGGSNDLVTFMPIADVSVPAFPAGGVVSVLMVEGKLVAESVAVSDGSRNQRYQFLQRPVIDGTLVVSVGGTPWTKADHGVDMAAGDTEYLVETNEQGYTSVIFGDGVNGQIPALASAITAVYKIGGGTRGNLTSASMTTIGAVPLAVLSVTNPAASTGGANTLTNAEIRQRIPANLRAKNGTITAQEIADKALLTAGVAKAFTTAGDPLTRTINLYLAPSGGGSPTDVLKNTVLTSLAAGKMVGQRIAVQDPTYKQLRMSIIAHIDSGFQQLDVTTAMTELLATAIDAGQYDFSQVHFGGLDIDGQPEASVDALHALFDSMSAKGVKRVEVTGLDVVPEARRLVATTGDGTVGSITTPTNDHVRREWVIQFTSPTAFVVKERIVGTVKQVQDAALLDDTQNFSFDLALAGFTTLNPDRRGTATYTVSSNSTTQITVAGTGLFLATEPGAAYYVERAVAAAGTVGVAYTALDKDGVGVLTFIVTAGASPFSNTDEIIIDIFPPLGDVIPRADEIGTLVTGNLTLTPAGGIKTA